MESLTRSQVRKPEVGVRAPAEAQSESVGFGRKCPQTATTAKLNERSRSELSTKEIRAVVCRRADGKCESCGAWVGENGADAHLDHRFGRGAGRPAESVANCWLLCIPCDAERTKPTKTDAAYWWGLFILHAQRYGYEAEALLADTKIEALRAKGLVSP